MVAAVYQQRMWWEGMLKGAQTDYSDSQHCTNNSQPCSCVWEAHSNTFYKEGVRTVGLFVCYLCSPLLKVSKKNSDMNWIQLLFPGTTKLWAFLTFVNWSEVFNFSVICVIAKNIVKSSIECVIMYHAISSLLNCIDKISRWKCINNNIK